MVVDDDGHVVRGESVGLEDHLVIGPRRVDVTTDEIVETELDVVRHAHAHDGVLGETGKFGPLLLGHAQAHAVVAGLRGLGSSPVGAQLGKTFLGAPAVVGMTVLDELVDVGTVGVQPFGLLVGAVRSTQARTLVGAEPEPVEGLVDLLLRALDQTVLVGVLDAKDELTTGPTGPGLVEQGHVGGSDVRITGGRRSYSGTCRLGGAILSHDMASLSPRKRTVHSSHPPGAPLLTGQSRRQPSIPMSIGPPAPLGCRGRALGPSPSPREFHRGPAGSPL